MNDSSMDISSSQHSVIIDEHWDNPANADISGAAG